LNIKIQRLSKYIEIYMNSKRFQFENSTLW